ncbi:MAG: hypothetical protein WAN61_03935 [Minisyncoccia bacterium]
MKINFLKKKNSFQKKNFTFNASLYWKLILLGALAIMLGSFFYGYHLFKEVDQDSVLLVVNTPEQNQTVNINSLQKMLNLFSNRAEKSNQILNSPAPVVDPSL